MIALGVFCLIAFASAFLAGRQRIHRSSTINTAALVQHLRATGFEGRAPSGRTYQPQITKRSTRR